MPKLSPPKLIEDLVSEIDSPEAPVETGLPHLLSNKVYLYSITSVISLLVIGFTIFVSQLSQESLDHISGILDRIGFMDLKLSYGFVQGFKLPSPVSILVIASNSAFILYAVSDSIKDRSRSKNHFKESYAVSYALHLLFLLVLFVTIFLAYTPKPKIKVNTIEFITTQETTKQKPPPETSKKSERPSIDQGKNDPNKPIKPVNKSPGKPQEPKKLVQAGDPSKPKSQAEPPKPNPMPKPKGLSGGSVSSDSKQPPTPAPKTRSQTNDNKLAPKDIKTDTASDSLAERAISKIPSPSLPTGSGSDFKPNMAKPSGSFSGGGLDGLPSPKNYSYSRGSGGGVGGGRGSGGGGTGSGIGTPKDVSQIAGPGGSGGQDLIDRLGNIKAPDNIDVSFGSDGLGNPNKNPYGDRPPSTASIPDVAFGPYMARIQEMIKQRWKPPRGSESKRIVVHFAINRDGSLSNLRLMQTNGDTLANEAALSAVRNAAAFPPLPVGSAPSIDIEFTFDYNVFKRSRY
jgi:TonB family protein